MLEFRRQPGRILNALERNEPVTLLYRGKARGVLVPIARRRTGARDLAFHPAFGMWRERADLRDPAAHVRRLRASRLAL